MHPAHGAGQIVEERATELVDGYRHYYVIEFMRDKLKLFVPVQRIQEIGLRGVMGDQRLDSVLDTLRDLPQSLPRNFRSRKAQIEKMIDSGRPTQVATAVRELTWRKHNRKLCQTDADLLFKAKKRLKSEIMLATDSSPRQVEQLIDEALVEAVQAKEQTMKQAA